MRTRYETLLVFVLLGSTPLAAQWLKYPTAGVPRKADGSVNMSAPAPRMADGKPDLSGIWTTADPNVPQTKSLSSPKETRRPEKSERRRPSW